MTTNQQNLLQTAREQAIEVLHRCATPYGFRASGLPAGYPQVWARDMAITALGAFASQDKILIACVRASLETLGKHQSQRGLIPLNVNPDTGYISTENAGAADANLWYIIAHYMYYQTTGDIDFLRDHWTIITRAIQWLEYQDMNECGLLEIPEAANWMDLVAVRYNTLYDNVLYYAATLAYGELYKALPDDLHLHVKSVSGYLSGDPDRVHFGIPDTAVIQSLDIMWSDGAQSTVTLTPDMRHIIITRGT